MALEREGSAYMGNKWRGSSFGGISRDSSVTHAHLLNIFIILFYIIIIII